MRPQDDGVLPVRAGTFQTFQLMASEDLLNRRIVEEMLVGVATRQHAGTLEPLFAALPTRGTSKNSMRLTLDGVDLGEHCPIVALEIAGADAFRSFSQSPSAWTLLESVTDSSTSSTS